MKTYSYSELKDSKIVYDKNPPKFMPFVVLIIITLLSALIFISIKTNKTYIVKGQGIVSSNNKQYIMSAVSGELISVNIKEGQKVVEGDVIAVVKSPDINLQKRQIEDQISLYEKRIALLERLEDDIINYKNSFNKDDVTESEFYYRIQSMYLSQSEYNMDKNSLKEQGYTDKQINEYLSQYNTKKQQIRSQYIDNTYKEKIQYITEKQKLDIQFSALESGEDEYKITATNSGIIHLTTPLNDGMVIQAGNALGTVSNNDNIFIETYITSADRSKINLNDEVSIAVSGLIQSDYGIISGEVVDIDSDATIREDGNILFKIKVEPNKSFLTSKNGDKVNLVCGMTSEVRVKYDEVSYFSYILDALGIKG